MTAAQDFRGAGLVLAGSRSDGVPWERLRRFGNRPQLGARTTTQRLPSNQPAMRHESASTYSEVLVSVRRGHFETSPPSCYVRGAETVQQLSIRTLKPDRICQMVLEETEAEGAWAAIKRVPKWPAGSADTFAGAAPDLRG